MEFRSFRVFRVHNLIVSLCLKNEKWKNKNTLRLGGFAFCTQRHRDIEIFWTRKTQNKRNSFVLFVTFVFRKNKPQIFGILGILITSVSEIIPLICAICVHKKKLCDLAFCIRGQRMSAEGASPNRAVRKRRWYRMMWFIERRRCDT